MRNLELNWINWTAEDIKRLPAEIIESNKIALEKVKTVPKEERNFNNTVLGMEYAGYESADKVHELEILHNVSKEKSIRDAAKDALNKIQREMVELIYSEDLWRSLEEYKEKNEKLEGLDKKLFEDTYLEFKRMGFALPKEKRDKVKENIKHLIQLEMQFASNINEHRDSIDVTEEELKGMDESFKGGLTKNADGTYKISLDYPEYFPFMGHAENAVKRQELMDKNLQKGGKENMEILKEVLGLRKENAQLLGYKNHVAFETEVLMAKNEKHVSDFLLDLGKKLKPAVDKELLEMSGYKKRLSGEGDIKYYDPYYYIEALQKEKFKFDSEKLREFFPLYKVKQGIFKIYSRLLGVKFEKIEAKLWAPEVEMYSIKDSNSGAVLAHFALDIFPREGKFSHACASPIVMAREEKGDYVLPFGALLMNFRKPHGETPSLLSHGEVETFFHEFGHLMHFSLGKPKYLSQSPFAVAWDFVEAPSQMLEYWVWNEESIKLLSEHYATKAPIPEEILSSLIKSKDFMLGYMTMRQIVFALYDFYLHTDYPDSEEKIADLYNKILKNYTGIDMPQGNRFPAGFGHLMGYDAKYYGYTWSKVFAADMFDRFKNEGILNEGTGNDYRKKILEPGSTKEEMDMVKDFLGREPSNRSFLEELGVE